MALYIESPLYFLTLFVPLIRIRFFSYHIRRLLVTIGTFSTASCMFLQRALLKSQRMSGFLSPEAEAALRGEEEQARRVFYQNQVQTGQDPGYVSRSPYQQPQWSTAPSMTSPRAQLQQPYAAPVQYTSWPLSSSSSLRPTDYGQARYPSSAATPVLPSSPYSMDQQYSSTPWPSLYPDDLEAPSDNSRSVSPSPADLHHFGIPLPDGKTWRCGYPQCSSQATFTRGCDLRKHFRRHTKTLFCRDETCPQSREGGFSSKKDRDRHESRHAPQIRCTYSGCERVFSRVDNMKDHRRRIHGESA